MMGSTDRPRSRVSANSRVTGYGDGCSFPKPRCPWIAWIVGAGACLPAWHQPDQRFDLLRSTPKKEGAVPSGIASSMP
jgi:hypothetical protein